MQKKAVMDKFKINQSDDMLLIKFLFYILLIVISTAE